MNDARISVIIPALDEASRIAAALLSARAGRDVETIVVDGGSRDGTVRVAEQNGATVVEAAPPRGDPR